MASSPIGLNDVLRAAAARSAVLTPETAGYVALGVVDALSSRPVRATVESIALWEDGSLSVEDVATDAVKAEHGLRGTLRQLLAVAVGRSRALRAVSERNVAAGLGSLQAETEAALIPVNRAAGRRALARLYREASRAIATGRLAKETPAASPTARATGVESWRPAVEQVPQPRVGSTPAPWVVDAPHPMTVAEPAPRRAWCEPLLEPSIGDGTPFLGTVITSGSDDSDARKTSECSGVLPVPQDLDDRTLRDVLTSFVEASAETPWLPPAEERPDSVRADSGEAEPSSRQASGLYPHAAEGLALSPAPTPAVPTEIPPPPADLLAAFAPEPPIEEVETPNLWPPVESRASEFSVLEDLSDKAEKVPLDGAPVSCEPRHAALVESVAEPEQETSRPIPTKPYVPRQSDLAELLAGFAVRDARTERELSRDLKRMAGLDPTPPPLSVATHTEREPVGEGGRAESDRRPTLAERAKRLRRFRSAR